MTLSEIKVAMRSPQTITPRDASNYRVYLANEYATNNDMIKDLMLERAKFFQEKRGEFKSDTACNRAFEITGNGVGMTALVLNQKTIEKMLSALNSYLKNAENEAKNIY